MQLINKAFGPFDESDEGMLGNAALPRDRSIDRSMLSFAHGDNTRCLTCMLACSDATCSRTETFLSIGATLLKAYSVSPPPPPFHTRR
jgi:hypothetical protein